MFSQVMSHAVQGLCSKAYGREASLMRELAQAAVAHARQRHVLSIDVYAVKIVWSKEERGLV
jgi:hypothetical protein